MTLHVDKTDTVTRMVVDVRNPELLHSAAAIADQVASMLTQRQRDADDIEF